MDVQRTQRRWAGIAVGVFLAALWLPLVVALATPDRANAPGEKRPLVQWPELRAHPLRVWPALLTAYYDDQVGLRDTLKGGYIRFVAGALGGSPTAHLVVGRDGWLFDGRPLARALASGAARYDDAQLAQWAATLEERRRWLAARGVRYLVVLVPMKGEIYPEELPPWMAPRAPTAYEQVERHLRRHTAIDLFDARGVLRDAKQRELVYYRTDGHWSARGAVAVERALARDLARRWPELRLGPEQPVAWHTTSGRGLGLAELATLPEAFPETAEWLTTPDPIATLTPEMRARFDVTRSEGPTTFANRDPSLARVVMFRDSFASALAIPLSSRFAETILYWNRDVDPDAVERDAPDLVIHEMYAGVSDDAWGPPQHALWREPMRPSPPAIAHGALGRRRTAAR